MASQREAGYLTLSRFWTALNWTQNAKGLLWHQSGARDSGQ